MRQRGIVVSCKIEGIVNGNVLNTIKRWWGGNRYTIEKNWIVNNSIIRFDFFKV